VYRKEGAMWWYWSMKRWIGPDSPLIQCNAYYF
jgi:hypothetical protein